MRSTATKTNGNDEIDASCYERISKINAQRMIIIMPNWLWLGVSVRRLKFSNIIWNSS